MSRNWSFRSNIFVLDDELYEKPVAATLTTETSASPAIKTAHPFTNAKHREDVSTWQDLFDTANE